MNKFAADLIGNATSQQNKSTKAEEAIHAILTKR
jgi:hypothetical protein